jgi:hypothetical protein
MGTLIRRHWMAVVVAAVLGICMPLTAVKLYKRLAKGSVDDAGLTGVSVPLEKVAPSLDNFLSGRLQKYVDDQLAKSVPLRKPAIRSFNQVWFDLFGSSYMYSGTILKGRDGQLYERGYLESYCLNHYDPAQDRARIDDWAATLARLQKWTRSQGKAFVYLITPNKAMYLPESLPPDFRCVGPARARYAMMIEALQRERIDYVDGSKTVLGLKAGAAFPLFPRGGTHWTYYPAALVTNELIAEVGRQLGASLRPLKYTYRLAAGRKEYDKSYTDLAGLLNLISDRKYESDALPVWEFGMQQGPVGQRLPTVVVGGSFNALLLPLMSDSGVFEPIEFYFYTTLGQQRYAAGVKTEREPGEGPRLGAAIAGAEVLILEENEQALVSAHGKLLVGEVLGSAK